MGFSRADRSDGLRRALESPLHARQRCKSPCRTCVLSDPIPSLDEPMFWSSRKQLQRSRARRPRRGRGAVRCPSACGAAAGAAAGRARLRHAGRLRADGAGGRRDEPGAEAASGAEPARTAERRRERPQARVPVRQGGAAGARSATTRRVPRVRPGRADVSLRGAASGVAGAGAPAWLGAARAALHLAAERASLASRRIPAPVELGSSSSRPVSSVRSTVGGWMFS